MKKYHWRHTTRSSILISPFRLGWRAVRFFFPRRDITTFENGRAYFYVQPTWARFLRFSLKAGLCVWALWSTYVFVYHRPLLAHKTREITELREQYAQQIADIVVYQKKMEDLHKRMTEIDEKIIASKRDSKEGEDILRQRMALWAQMSFLQSKLSGVYQKDYRPDNAKIAELEINSQLASAEINRVRERNAELEREILNIHEAQTQILDKVATLAKSNVDALTNDYQKVRSSIVALGLNHDKLVARAKTVDRPYLGGVMNALNLDKMKNIDPKYAEIASQINLWEGMTRTKTMLPVGNPVKNPYITSQYGNRLDPVSKTTTKKHSGIDFAGQVGTPLYAVAPGHVIKSGWRSGYGESIEVDHGMGFTTLYAHLKDVRVKRGDFVEAKDVIGLAGSTGHSTGPHLHYEIRYNNQPFNPYTFVKGRTIEF